MNAREKSQIEDIGRAKDGHLKIAWVKEHMPVLNRIRAQFEEEQPFAGLKVAISLHLEAKTAYLAKVIQAGGADVTITGSNPLSTQDDVCAALVEDGITVFARYNPEPDEYKEHLIRTLETEPDLIIDDGGDLVSILHDERQDLISRVRGGAEETTTGILRLKSLEKSGELKFPMIAVNDAYCKYLFDNRYGTGTVGLGRDYPDDQPRRRRQDCCSGRLWMVRPRRGHAGQRARSKSSRL